MQYLPKTTNGDEAFVGRQRNKVSDSPTKGRSLYRNRARSYTPPPPRRGPSMRQLALAALGLVSCAQHTSPAQALRVAADTLDKNDNKQMPRGYTACQNFMRNRKAQLLSGAELVGVVETMCQPAVDSGVSTYRYQTGCQEMQDVTAKKYGGDANWDPAALCLDLMTVFNRYSPANSEGFKRVLRSTTARALAMQQQQLQQFHYSQQSSSFNPPLKAPDRSGVNRQTKAKQNDVSSDEYTPEDSSSDEDYAHANASNSKSVKQQQKRDEERRQWQQSVEKMRRTANSLALQVQQNFAENKTQAAQLRVKKAISKGRTNLLTNLCDPYEEEVSCLPAEVLASYAKLKDYQKAGVRWLKTVTDAGFGGILADEMGLGKTAQTLTFLALQRSSCNVGPGSTATAARPAASKGTPASGSSAATSSATSSKPPPPSNAPADGRKKPVLIVAPVTLLRNWELETAKWTPHLRVFRYHSSSQKERWDLGLRYFAAEDAAKRKAAAVGSCNGYAPPYDIVLTTAHCLANRDDRKMFFMQIKFSYFIIDEAHYLKTNTTKRVQEMHKIKAERRVLLTGTPIQNSLSELCNLLWFCTPSVFQPLTELDTSPGGGTGGGNSASKAAKEQTKQSRQWVQNMSSAFLLRRLKGDVLKDLPEKRVKVMCCELTAEQRKLYNAEIDLAIGKGTSSASGAGGTSGSGLYSTSSTSSLSSDDGDRALLKDDAAAGGEAMANGVKSLDALPKASPRVSSNGGFGNGQVMRLMGEKPPGGPSAGTRQKKKAQAGASSNNQQAQPRATEQQHNTVNITASRFKTIFSRLRRICGAPLMAQTKFGPLQYRCLAQLLQTKRDDFAKAGLERTEKTVRDWSDFEVHQAAKTFRLPPPFFASADEITSGGKIQQLLQVLTNRSHKKTLVFSQYTQFLDVIEEALRLKGFRFVRLDGSTASEDRQQLVDDFSSEANVNETDTKSRLSDSSKSIQVFLLSTRAGGVGLNLVAADMVYSSKKCIRLDAS
eukprot:g8439.t1